MKKQIEIQNVGPVAHLAIPLPEGGGLVVLRGCNGSGKTHSLQAVSSLLSGDGKPPVSDGALGASVAGAGVLLSVSRRSARSGELECDRIDGNDPSLLADPHIKDQAAADRARIQALCRLARIKPSRERFEELLPAEELDQLCRADTWERADLPEMAAALKADLEAGARAAEEKRETAMRSAAALGGAWEGVDLSAPDHSAEAAVALQAATRALIGLEEGVRLSQERATAVAEALTRKAALDAERGEGDPQAAVAAHDAARARRLAAEQELEQARAADQLAEAEMRAALRYQKLASELERVIAAGVPEAPSSEALVAAVEAEASARAAVEEAATGRRARDAHARAQPMLAEAAQHDARAHSLRGAAAGCEQVLSAAINEAAATGLRVEAGRLVLDTDRGTEPYGELSPGERWRLALEIAAHAVNAGGLVPVAQEAYEAMDPHNKAAVAAIARELGIVVLTAEATDGELRAEVAEVAEVPER